MKDMEVPEDDDVTSDFVVPLFWKKSDDCWRSMVEETIKVSDCRVLVDVSKELVIAIVA